MNHKVIFISALLTVLVFGTAMIKAQNHIPDINLKRDFMAQVKSIDEFTARFNGDESKPGLTTENAREENKKLDESFLSLVNKVQIKDESFLALKIEDPFFGRITDMKDMLG